MIHSTSTVGTSDITTCIGEMYSKVTSWKCKSIYCRSISWITSRYLYESYTAQVIDIFHILTMICSSYLKSFPGGNNLFTMHYQHHFSWWPGDARRQCARLSCPAVHKHLNYYFTCARMFIYVYIRNITLDSYITVHNICHRNILLNVL